MRWVGFILMAAVMMLFVLSRQAESPKSVSSTDAAQAETFEPIRKIASEEHKPDQLDLKYKDVREGILRRRKYLDLKDPE